MLRTHLVQHVTAAGATLRALGSALFSFESLLFGYLLFFTLLGAVLAIGLFWTLLDDCDEADEYDACESGIYYSADKDGRWWIPVVVVDVESERRHGRPGVLVESHSPGWGKPRPRH